MSENAKNIIIGLVAIALIIGAYFFFVAGKEPDSTTTLTTVAGQPTLTGESGQALGPSSVETVALIRQLQGLNLQADFLDSPAFENLIDFSLKLNEQPVGRNNPFAPIIYFFPGPLFIQEQDSLFFDTGTEPDFFDEDTGVDQSVDTESTTSVSSSSEETSETEDVSTPASPFGDL